MLPACLPGSTLRPTASSQFFPTSCFSVAWNSGARYRTPILQNTDGSQIFDSPYPLLPKDKVRYVGQAVAMVVAETVAAAKDAVELIDIKYEPLPAVTETAAAADPSAPRLWDRAPSNVCLDAEIGDKNATDAAFSRAVHVISLATWIQRVTGVPMETRSGVGIFDATTERYTLYAGEWRGGAAEARNLRKSSTYPSSPSVSSPMTSVAILAPRNSVYFPEHLITSLG